MSATNVRYLSVQSTDTIVFFGLPGALYAAKCSLFTQESSLGNWQLGNYDSETGSWSGEAKLNTQCASTNVHTNSWNSHGHHLEERDFIINE